MDTKQIITQALNLIELTAERNPEVPATNEQLIMSAQCFAQIAIVQELARLNEQLASVIGKSASGSVTWVETYDNSMLGHLKMKRR